jgi:CRP-like cAMP-binding protein
VNLDPSAFVADPALLDGLESKATPLACSEPRLLFRQGDDPSGLYILKSGRVTLSMASSAGAEVLSVEACAGSLLGLPGLIGDQPYTLTAMAHAGAQLSFIPREAFNGVISTEPLLAFKILQVLSAEVRSARNAVLEQLAAPAARQHQLTHARRT